LPEERSTAFTTGLILDEKAHVTEDDGDIYIEGLAAALGLDDQDEYFTEGALTAAAAAFMAQPNRPLLFHHKPDQQLGEVLELEPRPEGLWMKARIDRPADSSPLLDVYNKVKRGTMKGLSVAGRFYGGPTPQGMRLNRALFREISVTPFPIHPETLAEVSQKAVQELEEGEDELLERRKAMGERLEAAAKTLAMVESMMDSATTTEELEEDYGEKAAGGASQRREWAKSGVAMRDGSFPITHCGNDSFSNGAARSRAKSGNASLSAIMAHIRKRESALKCKIGGAQEED
jgi:HK97 family phage prohead protease